MFDLKPGTWGVTKKFDVAFDGTRLSYSSKRGHEFIVFLIDVQKKKNQTPDEHKFKSIMGGLGFIGSHDLEECFGHEGIKRIKEFMGKKYSKDRGGSDGKTF